MSRIAINNVPLELDEQASAEMQNSLPIPILGAGAGGLVPVIRLAKKYPHIQFPVFNRDKDIMMGASGKNPGRMSHGHHYSDSPTQREVLLATIEFRKFFPNFELGNDLPLDDPLNRGLYLIRYDSKPAPVELLKSYKALAEFYSRLPKSEQLCGDPKDFCVELTKEELDELGKNGLINRSQIVAGVRTSERLLDVLRWMAKIRAELAACPNIKVFNQHEITGIYRLPNGSITIDVTNLASNQHYRLTNIWNVVNATWESAQELNKCAGLPVEPYMNRLKVLARFELPPQLIGKNSMFTCMGPYAMFSNLGQDRTTGKYIGMGTAATVTNLHDESASQLSQRILAPLKGKMPAATSEQLGRDILQKMTEFFPVMVDAKLLNVGYGVVKTQGDQKVNIQDPTSEFSKRAYSGVEINQMGWVTNNCIKLFRCMSNAIEVADNIFPKMFMINTILASLYSAQKQHFKNFLQLRELAGVKFNCTREISKLLDAKTGMFDRNKYKPVGYAKAKLPVRKSLEIKVLDGKSETGVGKDQKLHTSPQPETAAAPKVKWGYRNPSRGSMPDFKVIPSTTRARKTAAPKEKCSQTFTCAAYYHQMQQHHGIYKNNRRGSVENVDQNDILRSATPTFTTVR